MPAVKLKYPNRVNIHGILFERGIPRYVTNEIADLLEEDDRFDIMEGEEKGGVKIKRAAKVKPVEPELDPENPNLKNPSVPATPIEV